MATKAPHRQRARRSVDRPSWRQLYWDEAVVAHRQIAEYFRAGVQRLQARHAYLRAMRLKMSFAIVALYRQGLAFRESGPYMFDVRFPDGVRRPTFEHGVISYLR